MLLENVLAEELVRARARLAADANDLVVRCARDRDPELRPRRHRAVLGEDRGEIVDRDLLEWVLSVDVDRERVVPDGELLRLRARVLFRLLYLVGLHLTARVRDVDRAPLQRGDPDARSTARNLDLDARGDLPVLLGPRLSDVDHGVGALDLNRGRRLRRTSRSLATAARHGGGQKGQDE